MGIEEPRLDCDTILRLQQKVLCNVVYYDGAVKVPPKIGEILDEHIHALNCVVPIQSVVDISLGCIVRQEL